MARRMIVAFWVILFGYYCDSLNIESSVYQQIDYLNLDDWFNKLNAQYKILNQYSAYYAWELSVNPTEQLYVESAEFDNVRSSWRNNRCAEARQFSEPMSKIQKRMIYLLCRGPKFTDYQSSELSALLAKIQNIYTETEICLPIGYDICINYERIWNYTYIKTPNDKFQLLDMSQVISNNRIDHNPIHYFDGKISEDYYVFHGINKGIIPNESEIDLAIRKSEQFCMNIEPDLEKLMAGDLNVLKRTDCMLPIDLILEWAWEAWRLAIGPEIGKYYPNAIYLMNIGAQNNGYTDIGDAWREELEMINIRKTINKLWTEIKPLYKILHSVLRSVLWNKFKDSGEINQKGPIPSHLMGNMWSQDWSSFEDLLMPSIDFNLENAFRQTNWTAVDITKRADDFYSSIGLRGMPENFWTLSQFDCKSNKTKCHGSAANMFTNDDYRIIVCSKGTIEDLYVIVHEMGHIQYYMEYAQQPTIFQDATNSAFAESIGDAIFLAMMTPQHLNRLGILPDIYLFTENLSRFKQNELKMMHEWKINSEYFKAPTYQEIRKNETKSTTNNEIKEYLESLQILENEKDKIDPYPNIVDLNEKVKNYMNFKDRQDNSMNAFDLTLLMRMALSKIPQIPFEYILDIFRWDLFSGKVPFSDANAYFWNLSMSEQGIHPPAWRSRNEFFDYTAKFHIADNTPYVRYFLASFLQAQIFKGLCEMTVFGRVNTNEKLPMPLHRCDIYGSKRAGKLLRKALKMGASTYWTDVLYILSGSREIRTEPLLEYYEPLFSWLQKIVIDFDLPIGW